LVGCKILGSYSVSLGFLKLLLHCWLVSCIAVEKYDANRIFTLLK
jgi:hypothetical protein